MTGRAMESAYMHWAKNQPPMRFALSSSEVPHWPLDRLPIAPVDLGMTGASHYRYAPLRQAIADKEGVRPDNVVMANGTSMANFIAMSALIASGDEVLVERPVYEPLIAVARHLGAHVSRFDRAAHSGFQLDSDAVGQLLTPNTKLVIFTNLHNPSSSFADEGALREISVLAEQVGAYVLIDEVYLDAAPAPAPRSAFHLADNIVTTNSLTKVYGLSGLRCGWILAAPALAEKMWRLNDLFGVSQPHADERLACIALAHLAEISAGTPALLAKNRALANDFFASRDDLDVAPPSGGITAFPRLRSGRVDDLHALLRNRYETSIVPGHFFEMPDHFRMGIGGPTDMVEGGLARLGAALDTMR